jgi:ABC-type multidrug transport system fused ATPase/permease subunit
VSFVPPKFDGVGASKRPKRLRDFPKFLFSQIKGFLSRLFYIVSLVYESSPTVLFLMVFFCIFDGFLPVIGAYISKYLLDGIAALLGTGAEANTLADVFSTLRPVLFLLILQFIYLSVRKICERVNASVVTVAGELVVNHIKLKIVNKAKEIDMSSFDRVEFYEKLENANREAGMRPISILNATFNVISAIISAVSFIAVLYTLSPLAPLVIMVLALPGAFVNYHFRRKNFFYMRFHSKERRQMNYFSGLMVDKDRAKEIRILGLGDTLIGKYKSAFKKYYRGLKKLIFKEGVLRVLVGILSTLAFSLIFLYVAYDVVFNDGLIGDYSLYTGALTSLSGYVTTLVAATGTIYEGTLFIDNMMSYMKEKKHIVPSVENPEKVTRGVPHTIEFRNVSFSYPGKSEKVIDNVSFTINAGERVVLVGLNGAGKTTLIKLITRIYDVCDGEILLDGKNIKEYDTASYYDMFGIIFQDFGKYAVSASENIEFGDCQREHKIDDVVCAAKSADADGFLSELSEGYATPLTRMFEENGAELSGGQWQKLSVARAFYKNSDILILDEPTASLDALAEQAIYEQFSRLSKGKISIFVSHRLSSAKDAEKIIVLSGGSLAEIGTHKELMEKKGDYYLLFSTQAKRYTE